MSGERRAPRRSAVLAALAERFEVQNRTTDTSSASASTEIRPGAVQRVRTFNFEVLVALERAKDNPADIVVLSKAIQQSKDAGVPTSRIRHCEDLLAKEVRKRLEVALARRDLAELGLITSLGNDFLNGLPDIVQAQQLLLELGGSQRPPQQSSSMLAEQIGSQADGCESGRDTSLRVRGICSEVRSPTSGWAVDLQVNLHQAVVPSPYQDVAVSSGSRPYVPRKVKTYEYRDILALEAAKQGAKDIVSLQRAIQCAKDVCLPSSKIKACEDLVAKAEQDMLALQEAIESGNIVALESAVQSSSTLLKGQSEFLHAEQVLRSLATKELESAVANKDIATLELAIKQSRGILANQSILSDARRVLTDLRAAEVTNDLENAVDRQDISTLEIAIEKGNQLLNFCFDRQSESLEVLRRTLSDTEDVLSRLRIEHSKSELARAVHRQDITEIELAIEKHGATLIGLAALLDAKVALANWKVALCIAEVTVGISNHSVSRSIMASLRASMQTAESLGVETDLLRCARAILVEAESFELSHWCAVCLDEEKDALPLPCCGRVDGSNLLCDDCVANLARRAERCPFCRKTRVKRRD